MSLIPSVESCLLTNMNRSREWTCPHCKQTNLECLPDPQDSSAPSSDSTPSPASTPDCVAKPLTPVSEPTVPISFISEKDVPDDAIPSLPLPQAIEPPVKVYSPTPTRPIIPVSIVTPRAPGTPISRSPSVRTENSDIVPMSQDRSVLVRRGPRKPPIVLDTAICILLVLVFALICRRIL